jgi:hypothetical protein
MPRAAYLHALERLVDEPVRPGRWEAEAGPKDVAEWGRNAKPA